ncbi:MAG: PTS sugar transporter subunit IIC [Halanaerobium sp.]
MSKIEKIQHMAQEKVVPMAKKLNDQRHLTAIKTGLTMVIPFTVIGGIFLILAAPPIDPNMIEGTNFFFRFLLAWSSWAGNNYSFLIKPYQLTMGLLSIYAVVGISYVLAGKYKLNKINTSLGSLLIFLSVSVSFVDGNLTTGYLGAKGLFTAILIALLSVEITRFLDEKNIKIKLPDEVPPMVTAPFEALIPVLVNILVFMLINSGLGMFGTDIPRLMETILAPALQGADTLPTIIMIAILTRLLWFFGIHGNSIANAVILPILTANVTANAEAVASGAEPTAIFAGYFLTLFGAWAMLPALVLTLLVFAKSKKLKVLSKTALITSVFNINEPLTFGIPIVTNVFLFIPYVFLPAINVTIAYIITNLGAVGKFYIQVPFTTPGPISAFLATMDWKAPILYIALVALNFVLWIPFVKTYDSVVVKEEKENVIQ